MRTIATALALLVFLLAGVPARSQEEFIEAPSRRLTRIPFNQLTGGIVIINAKLNDYPDTLSFILDTGSSGISLDSTTAAELQLKPQASNRTIRGIAGIRTVPFLYDQTLRFPNLSVDSLDFHVNDYSILTAVYGERIDGIIGYSLLNKFIVKINYDSLFIDICSKGTIRYPKGGYLFKPVLSSLPVQQLRVRDAITINSRFLYDIGAGVCLMLSKDFVADSNLLNKKRKLLTKEGEGVGGKIDMHVTVIREVKLGPYRFKSVPTYIFDDVYNVTSYPYLGGLIGNDILRRFNTILNYDKKDFYLIPNTHFNDPFDYSYSGIELYYVEGYIIVGDVAKGSAAELAGLKEHDIVLAVNNNFSQNLNQYKIALQAPNQKIKLIIRRETELKEIIFKVASIK
ncbi:MAG TPA: aspartyl protease family protein [Chitinophagaceae bacterium]|nr:aspartyl protease family protein [Chitinophagaceae bacterium]